jgi:hypothetical protein
MYYKIFVGCALDVSWFTKLRYRVRYSVLEGNTEFVHSSLLNVQFQ